MARNKKLEKSKEIFKEYLNNKENILLMSEKEKYNWYLSLEEIIFEFIGLNRNLHKTTDEIRNFPTFLYQRSYNCSEQEAKDMLNEIADFVDNVDKEYFELRKNIDLSSYEKSLIYKETYFGVKSENDFTNIELISITTDEETQVYYEIFSDDGWDKKEETKDGFRYYKKARGTFFKNDIKFNVNKNNISNLLILEEGIEKEYTVKEFEKKYGDLNDFMYKELSELNVKNDEPIVKEAIDLISKFINLRTMTNIYFVNTLPFSTSRDKAVGKYLFNNIYITNKSTYIPKLEILIHEIGHYIHAKYFNYKQFRFSTKGKSKYAKKNYRENFAECFVDLIYCREDNERTRKMIKILSEIV